MEQPRGQVFSLFVMICLCGMTFVLAISTLITRKITSTPVFAWEITQFAVGLLGMLILYYMRRWELENHLAVNGGLYQPRNEDSQRESNVNTDFDEEYPFPNPYRPRQSISRNRQIGWKWVIGIPLREIFLVITCLGSLPLAVYRCIRSFSNIVCFGERSKFIIEGTRYIFFIIFCVVQMLFVLKLRYRRCVSGLSVFVAAVVVSSNFPLCLEVYNNVIGELKTQQIKAETTSNNSNVNLSNAKLSSAFVKCTENGTTFETDWVMEKLFRYTYQFPLEFAMLALSYLVPMWIWPSHDRTHIQNTVTEPSRRGEPMSQTIEGSCETDPLVGPNSSESLRRLKLYRRHVLWGFCIFVFLLFGVFVSHIVEDSLRDNDIILSNWLYNTNTTDIDGGVLVTYVQTTYSYFMIATAALGFAKIQQQKLNLNRQYSANDVILIFSSLVYTIFLLFETVDFIGTLCGIKTSDVRAVHVMYCVKILLQFGALYAQTALVIRFSKMIIQNNHRTEQYNSQHLIKCIVIYIGFCNLERWTVDKFLTPNTLVFVSQMHYDMYGMHVWWILNALLHPVVIVMRLQASIMCFEGYVRFQMITRY